MPNPEQYPTYRTPSPELPPHEQWAHSPTPTVTQDKIDAFHDKSEISSDSIPSSNSIDIETVREKRRMPNRHWCIRYTCCACCMPIWAASILWFIAIAIIIVIIVLGCIAGTFVMPTVELQNISTDTTSNSQISFSGDSLLLNFGLVVNVNNSNILNIKLSNMNAIAYYPLDGEDTRIGSGYLAYQYIPKHSNTNFTFPFSIEYNPNDNAEKAVIDEVFSKCGLTGKERQDITIDYTIELAAKVLFITVHPTITSSATFECPISSDSFNGIL